jgi:TolA-binding protein
MAQLTQNATHVLRELLLQPDGIPPYAEEAVRLALSQVDDHHRQMASLLALAAHRQQRQRQEEEEQQQQQKERRRQRRDQQGDGDDEDGGEAGAREAGADAATDNAADPAADNADAPSSQQQQQPPDWQRHPELAGAVLIHHEAIMRLKRVLLTYCKVRSDRLVALWWQARRLPEGVSQNLSPSERQFFREYDAAMRRYMGHGPGGLREDLTLDAHPPRDAVLTVRVLKDHGAVRTASSSSVPLVRGSVHCLALGEAEPLIRLGVLEALDSGGGGV